MKRILSVAILAVLVVSVVPAPALAQCGQDCSGYTPLDPPIPTPPSRSFTEFIERAYLGAYGRYATSDELCAEFSALSSAASAGHLGDEAKRFVAMLFETSDSYYSSGGTYYETAEYGALGHSTDQ